MRRFYDTESGEILTETELQMEFEILRDSGEIISETFAEYYRNCTGKNGTLIEINNYGIYKI